MFAPVSWAAWPVIPLSARIVSSVPKGVPLSWSTFPPTDATSRSEISLGFVPGFTHPICLVSASPLNREGGH